MLIIVLTTARHWYMSRARRIQSILSHFYLRFILILLRCEVNLLATLTSRAIPYVLNRQLLTVEARIQSQGVHVGYMVDRLVMGRIFSSSTSVSPCQLLLQNISVLTFIRGWYNRPI
jgi:hypothetical protein